MYGSFNYIIFSQIEERLNFLCSVITSLFFSCCDVDMRKISSVLKFSNNCNCNNIPFILFPCYKYISRLDLDSSRYLYENQTFDIVSRLLCTSYCGKVQMKSSFFFQTSCLREKFFSKKPFSYFIITFAMCRKALGLSNFV